MSQQDLYLCPHCNRRLRLHEARRHAQQFYNPVAHYWTTLARATDHPAAAHASLHPPALMLPTNPLTTLGNNSIHSLPTVVLLS